VTCRLYRIEGRVQGVWFRESTRREAEALGIRGYAKNLPDGSVQVLACGTARDLEQLAAWLQQGPPMARVSRVSGKDTDATPPAGFLTA
jgi:acylphosphatase